MTPRLTRDDEEWPGHDVSAVLVWHWPGSVTVKEITEHLANDPVLLTLTASQVSSYLYTLARAGDAVWSPRGRWHISDRIMREVLGDDEWRREMRAVHG